MSQVYSVGYVSRYIQNMFSQDFFLEKVNVRGEVSNCKYHQTGNIYFSLKDEEAVISCMVHVSRREGVPFHLEDGQRVVAAGAVRHYIKGGQYRLYVSQIRRDGLGELYERFEALHRELAEMGMFDPVYKKPLPKYPRTVGVVTAPTGDAIHDIIVNARRQDPGIRIIVAPAKVQGEGAAASIAAGIRALDEYGVDVIIVGRGGGSIEDLWAFNEVETAEAIFACRTPVVTGIGHTKNGTIADLVADLSASTPNGAAVAAVPDVRQILADLGARRERLQNRMELSLRQAQGRLAQEKMRLKLHSPGARVREQKGALAAKEEILRRLMTRKLESSAAKLALDKERLRALDPLTRLEQGYAYVEDAAGGRISRAAQAEAGQTIFVRFGDGSLEAVVTGKEMRIDDGEDRRETR